MTPSDFRPDINGLRAWAVVAVVLYHFGVTGFSGGFVGVDVFFVISGYLMTKMIVTGLEGGRFSIVGFYLARARRIVPALLVLAAVLLVIGWFLLPPWHYRQLGKHAVSAAGFFSNIIFWLEAGYFDAESHRKWLLHTWSLSVEWQFYLLLPVVLALFWRLGRAWGTAAIVVMFAASLAASVIVTGQSPSAAFYLLPTRAWEMLAGGLVFLWPWNASSEAARRAVEAVGCSLIVAAIALADAATWPGWRAVVPVLGTCLVILAARQQSILTASAPAQWLGNISYSLYLWHWPVVVVVLFIDPQNMALAVVLGILASLALGQLSWALVENRTRAYLAAMSRWKGALSIGAGAAVVASAALAVIALQGISGRLDPKLEQVYAQAQDINPRRSECERTPPAPPGECIYGGPELGAIVVGDSHAATVVRSVEKALPKPGTHVLDWTYTGCATAEGAELSGTTGCSAFVSKMLATQRELPPVPVLIVNRGAVYLSGPNEEDRQQEHGKAMVKFAQLTDVSAAELKAQFRARLIATACQFAAHHPTYMLRPIPEMKRNVPQTMGRSMMLGKPQRLSISMEEYRERHAFILEMQDEASRQCGVKILDPLPYFCSDGRCWGDRDGIPIYSDDDHLSERGAALLLPLFRGMFR